ncbi:MAG: putative zinc-binding metallopeptidase, partial [Ilumatobacteraceae bacterium]
SSCRLTAVRPSDGEVESLEAFADAESAKRRLLHQLATLGLEVIARSLDEERGVSFEFLSSRGQNVITGHDSGVITLDLSESDDAHREFVRKQLGEPYRTVLGHLRHEIGHYYWPRLVVDTGRLDAFRQLFGDDRVSYEVALEQHYSGGTDVDWSGSHVSHYATMHPWEDWAETFAHYLHINAGLTTAAAIGLDVGEPADSAGRAAWETREHIAIGPTVQSWLGLSLALNAMARSIGQADLYPFVLSPLVVEKLDFVHRAVSEVTHE